jgi:hypothetical protein
LKKYCYDWQLTVNVNKTKNLTFQKVFTPTPAVFYENKPLKEVKEYNYLGNTIDSKGNSKRYIQEIDKKGLKVLFSLSTFRVNYLTLLLDQSYNITVKYGTWTIIYLYIEPCLGLRKIIKLVTSYLLITKRHMKKIILNIVKSFWDLNKLQVILPQAQS